jgi:hypothetical protein
MTRKTQSCNIFKSAAVILLLFAVVDLAALAKNSRYLPASSPAHHLSVASKTLPTHSPAVLDRSALQALAAVVPPRPLVRKVRPGQLETIPTSRISLNICIQHRSPPSLA